MTAARRRSSDGAHSGSAAAPELPATSHLLVDRSHLGTPWLRFRGRSPWPEGRRPDRERASHACRGWQHRRVRLRHTHRGGLADRRLHLSALARSSTTTSRSSATGSGNRLDCERLGVTALSDDDCFHPSSSRQTDVQPGSGFIQIPLARCIYPSMTVHTTVAMLPPKFSVAKRRAPWTW